MISKDQLKQTLLEQKEAILRKPLGIERTLLNQIKKKAQLPHVVVLTGLRRSGKSTLLRQLMKKHYHQVVQYMFQTIGMTDLLFQNYQKEWDMVLMP